MTSRVADAFSFVAGAWRLRPLGKRVLTVLAVIMMLAGAGMLSYPVYTNLYTSRQQSKLSEEFAAPEFKSRFSAGNIEDGQVLTRIIIPAIGVDALVVEGTDPRGLRAGAGHYKGTPLPCRPGNVAIAGHRTTYGKPFERIDELKPGDEITLITPEAQCTYIATSGVSGKPRPRRGAAGWITTPDDGSVLGPLEGSFVTLTTCHPKRSAKERLILRAQLEK